MTLVAPRIVFTRLASTERESDSRSVCNNAWLLTDVGSRRRLTTIIFLFFTVALLRTAKKVLDNLLGERRAQFPFLRHYSLSVSSCHRYVHYPPSVGDRRRPSVLLSLFCAGGA